MNNFLMVVLTSLPDDIQGFWNMDILGYTTIGTIATMIGSVAYTLIKAKIQRKAIAKGQENASKREDTHYKELLERIIKLENKTNEQDDDIVLIADNSFRKEVKQIGEKYRKRINKEKTKEFIQDAIQSPIVQEVVEQVKSKFR